MVLQPCGECGRHVDVNAIICPFCKAACSPREPRAFRAGRLARAAVFAGASLAACDQGGGKQAEHSEVKAPTSAPRVHGVVTDQKGAPLVGVQVTLQSHMTPKTYSLITDHRGRYSFDEIEAGSYLAGFTYSSYTADRQVNGNDTKQLVVQDTSDILLDIRLTTQDMAQQGMPYGAPPARRRVV